MGDLSTRAGAVGRLPMALSGRIEPVPAGAEPPYGDSRDLAGKFVVHGWLAGRRRLPTISRRTVGILGAASLVSDLAE